MRVLLCEIVNESDPSDVKSETKRLTHKKKYEQFIWKEEKKK